MELFQDAMILKGSFDIDSLNLSNTKWSVWFPNVEAVVVGTQKRELMVKRTSMGRHATEEKEGNRRKKVFIWFRVQHSTVRLWK